MLLVTVQSATSPPSEEEFEVQGPESSSHARADSSQVVLVSPVQAPLFPEQIPAAESEIVKEPF